MKKVLEKLEREHSAIAQEFEQQQRALNRREEEARQAVNATEQVFAEILTDILETTIDPKSFRQKIERLRDAVGRRIYDHAAETAKAAGRQRGEPRTPPLMTRTHLLVATLS
ncbi:MAG: hypothetical protein AAB518_02505 [Patescibacteria group bacterium]